MQHCPLAALPAAPDIHFCFCAGEKKLPFHLQKVVTNWRMHILAMNKIADGWELILPASMHVDLEVCRLYRHMTCVECM